MFVHTQRHKQPVSRLANTNLTGAGRNIDAKAMWLKLKVFFREEIAVTDRRRWREEENGGGVVTEIEERLAEMTVANISKVCQLAL